MNVFGNGQPFIRKVLTYLRFISSVVRDKTSSLRGYIGNQDTSEVANFFAKKFVLLSYLCKPIMLKQEFEYYLEHQDELTKAHYGRYVVIHKQTVIGDFTTELEAIIHAKNELGLEMGTFLVQLCMPGVENYTQFFHSRVMISH